MDFIHTEFRRPVRLSTVASVAGVHPVYLTRAFQRHFGRTPMDMLRELRVEWAVHLLVHTELPLSRIALDCGFSDQSHLTRAFGARTGSTPGTFRRRCR